MSTEKQRDANRRNAQLSAGPRSDEGKARSSRNALKHGICVSDLALKQDEVSHQEIQTLIDSYFDHHQPQTLEERDALEELATCKVRLNIIRRVENGALNLSRREVFADHTFSDPAGNTHQFFDPQNWGPEDKRMLANMHLAAAWTKSLDLFDRLSRYEGRLYQRYRRAQDRWDALKKARAPQPVQPEPQPEPQPDPQPETQPPADPEFALIRVHSRPNNPPPLPSATPAQNEPNFDLTPSPATPADPPDPDKERR
jgi:hypothetical protein